MKTNRLFWGLILVYVGGIILLENFEIIHFSWRYVWRLWPLILIISGINILFSRSDNKTGIIVSAVITILGLGLITYKGTQTRSNDSYWGWSGVHNNDNRNVENSSSHYSEDYSNHIKIARLDISGGASEFKINSKTDRLFEANVNSSKTAYLLKRVDQDSLTSLNFEVKGEKNFNLGKGKFSKVVMNLNPEPFWDLYLKMGAGEADFDLKKFKVRTVDLQGGAAEFKVELGDLSDVVHVNAETGIASVKIKVPKTVGCSIINESGLSSKKFDGFNETNKGEYETSNFNSATKKVFIHLKGGLSNLEVEKYD